MSFRALLIYPPVSFNEQGAGKARGGDPDLYFMPYGMLTLAAELRFRGFEVDVLNLSTYTWSEAVEEIRDRPADLYGLSCHTVSRHVVARLGAEIRQLHVGSHVAAGGPHVSPLATEWLSHYPDFDSVVVGEAEATLVELCERLRDGQETDAIPGTAYRGDNGPRLAPPRPPIEDLDSLARPWEHFDYGFLITSRGCPGKCSFCCSPQLWGHKIRFRSAENVLEELEQLVGGRGHRYLHIKDDTFTANKKRSLAICQGINDRGLIFRWACDTRVDLLDPEIVAAMRRAGCVKVNLGIESANAEVLAHLNKRTDMEQVRQVTTMIRDVGMDIRYYLIAGGRGETPQTLRETFEFLDLARPTHVLLGGLAVYPGTLEFERAQRDGIIATKDYFSGDALTNKILNLGEQTPQMEQLLSGTFKLFGDGEKNFTSYALSERETILANHPEMLRSHTDMAIAYAREWRLDEAETVLSAAADRFGEDNPELLHHRACIRFARFDLLGARALFDQATQSDPRDTLLQANLNLLGSAEVIDYQNHHSLTERLLANLTSTEFLYALDGDRELTMPGVV
jgi:radical SAM superfamily enzyme YgiQ (UPF0313 family)